MYGRVKLPAGFGIAILPADAEFESDADDSIPITLSTGYNAIRILVSIGQLIYASSTLYRSRGDQIEKYGYAAFGLTVSQYALMSLLNLLGSLVCPQYPTLYLIESTATDEARKIPGTVLEGTVGRLAAAYKYKWAEEGQRRPPRTTQQWWKSREKLSRIPFALAPTVISVLIIWSLSHFHERSSTLTQRAWIISWLALGSIIGLAGAEVRDGSNITERGSLKATSFIFIRLCLGGAPAIGSFVVVGKMLQDYGVCSLIS
jgi:hypothetical protein